jgi:hypothetical protein
MMSLVSRDSFRTTVVFDVIQLWFSLFFRFVCFFLLISSQVLRLASIAFHVRRSVEECSELPCLELRQMAVGWQFGCTSGEDCFVATKLVTNYTEQSLRSLESLS